jgi:hypothetical protein
LLVRVYKDFERLVRSGRLRPAEACPAASYAATGKGIMKWKSASRTMG